MKRPELLAPAGNMDSLHAAIMAGCDAVYLGGKLFGARSYAANFDNEELTKAIEYAHLYGVKVYVTVNTLIYDKEVDTLLDYVKFLAKIGVDAVIMQDIGMINLVRQVIPSLDVHASTQLHIHNLDGALLVEKMGLTRTVLARETPIEEIKHIHENSNIELEIFVHGALCISYSGQCLMSSLIGGRSGNRGSCAGSCRLEYDLVDKDGNKVNKDKYLLSTKDLNSLERIGQLIDIGVDSFKIEGRMKRPEYVYIVVSLYRKAIDSYMNTGKVSITDQDIYNLKKVFNREFTKGFLFNENNNDLVNEFRPNHIGVQIGKVINYHNSYATIKLTDDLNSGDGIRVLGNPDTGLTISSMFCNRNKVTSAHKGDIISLRIDEPVKINSTVLKTTDLHQLKQIERDIKESNRKVLIKGQIELKLNNPIKLVLDDSCNKVEITYGMVDSAKNYPVTKEKIIDQITKLGNTIYKLDDLEVIMDDNIFINIKDLNEIRRLATLELNKKRLIIKPYKDGKYQIDVPNFEIEKNINIKISDIDIYNKIKNNNYKYIYVDNMELYKMVKEDNRVIYMTPRVINKYDDYNTLVQIEEFGGIKRYKDFMTGAFFNVTNSYTLALLHSMGSKKVTLSYELPYDRVKDLLSTYEERYHKHPNVEVITYGNEEAMISKFNLLKKFNVTGEYYLKDRFHNNYPIKINNDKMIIYNYKPRNLEENYFEIGVNNIRLDVLDQSQLNDIKNIMDRY